MFGAAGVGSTPVEVELMEDEFTGQAAPRHVGIDVHVDLSYNTSRREEGEGEAEVETCSTGSSVGGISTIVVRARCHLPECPVLVSVTVVGLAS